MSKTRIETRLADLRARMVKTETDLVALAPGAHMDWLLGFHPHPDERPCLLLVGQKEAAFLMPALNAEGSREATDIAFHEWADADGPDTALHKALEATGTANARSVALDETMRADFALLLLDNLANVRRGYSTDTVGALRMRKDDREYDLLKENALLNDRAFEAAFAAMRAGMSETDVADIIRANHEEQGVRTEFCIVGSGPNGAFPHHATGDRILQEGDALVIDAGGRKGGFPSDMTRMVAIGRPPEGYDEIHDVVERAVQAAMAAARPGVKAKAVDEAARSVIADAGYGEYFVHRTGHGLGIEVHEPPYITATSETVLDEGMVFSIEPGIYLPGRFGIRLEDIVILRADGPEILSDLSRDLVIINA